MSIDPSAWAALAVTIAVIITGSRVIYRIETAHAILSDEMSAIHVIEKGKLEAIENQIEELQSALEKLGLDVIAIEDHVRPEDERWPN